MERLFSKWILRHGILGLEFIDLYWTKRHRLKGDIFPVGERVGRLLIP